MVSIGSMRDSIRTSACTRINILFVTSSHQALNHIPKDSDEYSTSVFSARHMITSHDLLIALFYQNADAVYMAALEIDSEISTI